MPQDKSFFAGLEEIFARLLGLVLTIIFFLIYIVAIQELILDWRQALILLTIFWLVYETVSLILFSVFRFFAKQKEGSDQVEVKDKNEPNIESRYETTATTAETDEKENDSKVNL